MAVRRGRLALWTACLAGLLHAAASLYWALGGRWLVATVGEQAQDLVDSAPLAAGASLAAIAVAKAAGALVPVFVASGRIGRTRLWRSICWGGGSVLLAYGTLNSAVAFAVLRGWLRSSDGFDLAAMRGHAYLWDPLFAVWGAGLLLWLVRSREPVTPTRSAR